METKHNCNMELNNIKHEKNSFFKMTSTNAIQLMFMILILFVQVISIFIKML